MPIPAEELLELRPWAFHTTTPRNFEAIRHWGRLRSAQNLLSGTAHAHLLTTRRTHTVSVSLAGVQVEIRDQRPLAIGAMSLAPGVAVADYLAEINRRVFLWPGRERPIAYGGRHLERYRNEGSVVVLRVPTADLLAANPDNPLQVTRCNSGSARCHQGRPVARGPKVFRRLEEAEFRASQVVELCFVDEAQLPPSTQFASKLDGPWEALF